MVASRREQDSGMNWFRLALTRRRFDSAWSRACRRATRPPGAGFTSATGPLSIATPLRMSTNAATARRITQETFVAFLEQSGAGATQAPLTPWLLRIAKPCRAKACAPPPPLGPDDTPLPPSSTIPRRAHPAPSVWPQSAPPSTPLPRGLPRN